MLRISILRSCCSRRLLRLEALTAKYGSSLSRFKRNGRFLLASRTDRFRFDLAIAGSRQAECLRSLPFASLATLRLVLELFVVEEKLFARSKDKIFATVYALQSLVLEFHWSVAPFSPCTQITKLSSAATDGNRFEILRSNLNPNRFAINLVFDLPRDQRGLRMRMTARLIKMATTNRGLA